MRPATLRRLLVFGVCALGVTSLYLLPDPLRSPITAKEPGDQSRSQPTGRVAAETPPRGADRPTVRTVSRAADEPADPGPDTDHSEGSVDDPVTPVRSGSTGEPVRSRPDPTRERADRFAPDPVEHLEALRVTPDRVTVCWSPAADNVQVVSYRVWLNGFQVAETAGTRATLTWFNDDSSQHVVRVKARDAAGNEAESSPNLLLTRPPEPPGPAGPTRTPLPPGESPSLGSTPVGPPPSSSAPSSPSPTRPTSTPRGPSPSRSAAEAPPADPSASPLPSVGGSDSESPAPAQAAASGRTTEPGPSSSRTGE